MNWYFILSKLIYAYIDGLNNSDNHKYYTLTEVIMSTSFINQSTINYIQHQQQE